MTTNIFCDWICALKVVPATNRAWHISELLTLVPRFVLLCGRWWRLPFCKKRVLRPARRWVHRWASRPAASPPPPPCLHPHQASPCFLPWPEIQGLLLMNLETLHLTCFYFRNPGTFETVWLSAKMGGAQTLVNHSSLDILFQMYRYDLAETFWRIEPGYFHPLDPIDFPHDTRLLRYSLKLYERYFMACRLFGSYKINHLFGGKTVFYQRCQQWVGWECYSLWVNETHY